MDALELLLTRRSAVVRNLGEPGPTDDELVTIVSAGIRVPDHGKLYPWRIQILDGDAQIQLGEVFAATFAAENPEATEDEIEIERQRPTRAPALIVVTSHLQPDHPKIPVIEQTLSGGAVCQNLINAAHALGYGAQWITEWPAYDDDVKRALGHDAAEHIAGFVYIGTPVEPPSERRRAQLGDVVTWWRGVGDEERVGG